VLLDVRIAHVFLDRHARDDAHAAEQRHALLGQSLHGIAGKHRRHMLVRLVLSAAVFKRFGVVLGPRVIDEYVALRERQRIAARRPRPTLSARDATN
jgi:hypothetical protein